MKRITVLVLCIAVLLCGCGRFTPNENKPLNIVTSCFPLYDFARAICGDNADITLLIKPGTEVHSYDPSPSDIAAVYNADLFLYIGGESEVWANRILNDINVSTLALINVVEPLEEGECAVDEHNHDHGHSKHHTFDEHIWTSPENAIIMLEKICESIISLDENNKQVYLDNLKSYTHEIEAADKAIIDSVKQSESRFILVADRFPFAYLANRYGISYEAAFGGCAATNDISLKTMTRLIDVVKDKNCKAAFYVEMSNKSIANALKEETGIKLLELHSAHNVTLKEFESGITYADIMLKNAESLRKGMQ